MTRTELETEVSRLRAELKTTKRALAAEKRRADSSGKPGAACSPCQSCTPGLTGPSAPSPADEIPGLLSGDGIPPPPPVEPDKGDLTPEFVRWLVATQPTAAVQARYADREHHLPDDVRAALSEITPADDDP